MPAVSPADRGQGRKPKDPNRDPSLGKFFAKKEHTALHTLHNNMIKYVNKADVVEQEIDAIISDYKNTMEVDPKVLRKYTRMMKEWMIFNDKATENAEKLAPYCFPKLASVQHQVEQHQTVTLVFGGDDADL